MKVHALLVNASVADWARDAATGRSRVRDTLVLDTKLVVIACLASAVGWVGRCCARSRKTHIAGRALISRRSAVLRICLKVHALLTKTDVAGWALHATAKARQGGILNTGVVYAQLSLFADVTTAIRRVGGRRA